MGKVPDGVRLSGNTLRVYTYIFKVTKSSIKDVQTHLNLKSHALAQYHLDKLVAMGLVSRNDITGEYFVVKDVKVETLEQFIKFGTYISPRLLLYAVTLSVIFGYYTLVISGLSLNVYNLWTFLAFGFGLAVLWYETLRAWRNSP